MPPEAMWEKKGKVLSTGMANGWDMKRGRGKRKKNPQAIATLVTKKREGGGLHVACLKEAMLGKRKGGKRSSARPLTTGARRKGKREKSHQDEIRSGLSNSGLGEKKKGDARKKEIKRGVKKKRSFFSPRWHSERKRKKGVASCMKPEWETGEKRKRSAPALAVGPVAGEGEEGKKGWPLFVPAHGIRP